MKFLFPAGTSRGVLTEKDSWFILLSKNDNPGIYGIGECSFIPGLSIDDPLKLEHSLSEACSKLNEGEIPDELLLDKFPSIRFGLETAMFDLNNGGRRLLFDSGFTAGIYGIPINGLIWMGKQEQMIREVGEKLEAGFRILKLKIGALDFMEEMEILRQIRKSYSREELEIRLDANGAWNKEEAIEKLKQLSNFSIHSLEQPIAAGHIEAMAEVCEKSSIDIALDEELIGITDKMEKEALLQSVNPAFIILKPSLLGGFKASEEWIQAAGQCQTAWWITSALESNIGLNAISQWTATKDVKMPQGLGTGKLFSNNIPSPLEIRDGKIYHLPDQAWNLKELTKD